MWRHCTCIRAVTCYLVACDTTWSHRMISTHLCSVQCTSTWAMAWKGWESNPPNILCSHWKSKHVNKGFNCDISFLQHSYATPIHLVISFCHWNWKMSIWWRTSCERRFRFYCVSHVNHVMIIAVGHIVTLFMWRFFTFSSEDFFCWQAIQLGDFQWSLLLVFLL